MSRDAAAIRARRRARFLAGLVLVLANLAVYGRVVTFGFLSLDDDRYVTANPAVLSGVNARSAAWAFTSFHASNWHPLTWLSHMLDCQLFGPEPGPHHAVNLLIHIASTLLLFLLWTRLTGALAPSFLLAVLFSLHPLRAESVAWVAERKDVLGTLFWVLTLLAYSAYSAYSARSEDVFRSAPNRPADPDGSDRPSESSAAAGRRIAFGAVFVLMALGLLAKPMLVSLPIVMLLLDFWPLGRFGHVPVRRLLVEKLPFALLALLSCAITLEAQNAGGAVKSLDAVPLDARLANALVAIPRYLGMMLWPAGLAVHYPYRLHLPEWQVVGAALFLILASGLALFPVVVSFGSRTRGLRPHEPSAGRPPARLTLAPRDGLPGTSFGSRNGPSFISGESPSSPRAASGDGSPEGGVGSRNGPSAISGGISVSPAGASGAARALAPPPYGELAVGWAWFLITLVPVIGIVQVGSQSIADRYTYIPMIGMLVAVIFGGYRYLASSPGAARRLVGAAALLVVALSAAAAWRQTGFWRNNLALFERGAAVEPDDALSHYHLAHALEESGEAERAIAEYREAVRILPSLRGGHYFLGLALEGTGRVDEAAAEFRQEIARHPDHAPARCALGLVLVRRGKIDAALEQFERATLTDPAYAVAWHNRATALEDLGRLAEAEAGYARAAALDPADEDARRRLDALRSRRGASPR